MANATFVSQVDMSTLDPADWFDVGATNRSSTSMDFDDGEQIVRVTGTGFTYEELFFPGSGFWAPNSGVVSAIEGDGPIEGTITGLDVDITDIRENASNSEELLDLFFGGRDVMKGSSFNDTLYGYGDNDNIKGGKGSDVLNGGEGTDKLTGGKGADTFVLNLTTDTSKKHPDLIVDLDDAKDQIDLTNMEIQGGITASYNEDKKVTTFAIDSDGNGKADAWINASGDHTDFEGFLI